MHCSKEFDAKRDSARYCSDSCRTSANKLRRKNEQKEKDRQIAAIAKKELEDQKKLIDDEMRKQKAEKRKKAKEEKLLKVEQNNDNILYVSSQGGVDIPEPKIQHEDIPKQLDEPVINVVNKKPKCASEVKKRFEERRKPKFTFWGVVGMIAKDWNDHLKKK